MKRNARIALNWANKVRKEYGCEPLDDLPKGIKASTFSCPLAQAFHSCAAIENEYPGIGNLRVFADGGLNGLVIGLHLYRDGVRTMTIPGPKGALRFVREFDKGEYPEYVK